MKRGRARGRRRARLGLPDDADESDLMGVLDLSADERARSTAFGSYLDDSGDHRAGTGG